MLDVVLDRVALQIEKEEKIKRRVKGAMIYPIVVSCSRPLVMTGTWLFLVPIFVKIFDQSAATRHADAAGAARLEPLLRGYWFIIFPVIGIMIFGFLKWKKTEVGRRGGIALRVPAQIGTRRAKVAMARWSRTLSTRSPLASTSCARSRSLGRRAATGSSRRRQRGPGPRPRKAQLSRSR